MQEQILGACVIMDDVLFSMHWH